MSAVAGRFASDLQHMVEQFLYHEARLLDGQEWDAWLALFDAQGMYWVPRERGQSDMAGHVSLFLEDAMLRSVRMRRLRNARNWSQQPPTFTSRLVGNVTILDTDGDLLKVRSTFQMLDYRGGEQRMFGGWCTHTLSEGPDGGEFKVRLKRVDLLSCDAVHENLQVFF